jgi:NAD dependent epimerase/dehydratase family enzyme
MGEFAQVLLDSQRVVPAKALESGYAFRFPDLDGALREAVS